MNRIVLFPVRNLDALWNRYAALARAVAMDQTKLIDPEHMKAMARAHDEWRDAFLASERRA